MKPLQTTQITYQQACCINSEFYCICVYHHKSESVFGFATKKWTTGYEEITRKEMEDKIGYFEMDKEFNFIWFHTL